MCVGYYKRGTGRSSLTWPESVEQALCFGWIDGIRQLARARVLHDPVHTAPREEHLERRQPRDVRGPRAPRPDHRAGRAAYERRREDRTAVYSFENSDNAAFPPEQEALFRADDAAWAFFSQRPASYRTAAIWWVVSAKREDTRERRLAQLIADSAAGRTVPPLTRR